MIIFLKTFLSLAFALSFSPQQIEQLHFDKKIKVVAFMSPDCPCSIDHEPLIKSSQDENKDIQYMVITTQDPQSHFKNFPITVIPDQKHQFANLFKVARTPHVFLLDEKNQILFQGGMTDSRRVITAKKNYLKQALEDYRMTRPIQKSESKVLGCELER